MNRTTAQAGLFPAPSTTKLPESTERRTWAFPEVVRYAMGEDIKGVLDADGIDNRTASAPS